MDERDRVSEGPLGNPTTAGTPKETGTPRGLEVLLKKAAVDPAFKALLLTRRAEAAATIDLTLEPSEILLLRTAPSDQLEAIIARTTVPQEHRRAFLGQAAAAMLAALGIVSRGAGDEPPDKTQPPPGEIGPTPPSASEMIETHVKEVIAKRFGVEKDKVKPSASLLDLVKAGASRPMGPPVVIRGVMARPPDNVQLTGLKRQLEKDYTIKLEGDDFFQKVKTVGDLVKAVQKAVKERPDTPVPEPKPRPDVAGGVRPDRPRP